MGWLVEPGFGPIDREVAATVEAAADALKDFGHTVESVRIPALERDFALDVFTRLHVLEMKPGFVETTAGRSEDEIGDMARFMLSLPDTPAADYIDAAQAAERLKDGYAEYFQKYDVLLTPVLPTAVLQARPGGVADRRPDCKRHGHHVRDNAVERYRPARCFHAVRHEP